MTLVKQPNVPVRGRLKNAEMLLLGLWILVVRKRSNYYFNTKIWSHLVPDCTHSFEHTLINELVSLTVDCFDPLIDGHDISLQ